MKRFACISTAVALAAAVVFPGKVFAHKINPLEDKYTQHENPTRWQRISEPVHEEITKRARACAAAAATAPLPLACAQDAPAPAGEQRGNKYDSLMRGVWWNDDPNQLLFAGWQLKWLAWMDDAERIAKHKRNWKGRAAEITPDYYMTYRSHYGDLQFLHAMASDDGELAADTRDRLLDWAGYAYAVATGRIDHYVKFEALDDAFVRLHFAHRPGWTTNYLFAPKYQLRDALHNRRMALGALLHTVQDSYSSSHAARSLDASPRCASGRVRQFYAYNRQDPDLHGEADKRAGWQGTAFNEIQNPVNVSATLIAFAERDTDWPTVRTYLVDTVFCLDADSERSGPGPYGMQESGA